MLNDIPIDSSALNRVIVVFGAFWVAVIIINSKSVDQVVRGVLVLDTCSLRAVVTGPPGLTTSTVLTRLGSSLTLVL